MIKNIFKLKNLYVLIAITALAYGGYYFGTQNTDATTNNKTLELTTVSIQQGDLSKKEEYNGTLRQTDSKILKTPIAGVVTYCLLYTSPSPRDGLLSRMPSSA